MTLEKAIQLREHGQPAEAMNVLKELLAVNPHDPAILYQCAWTCDVQGLEREAVPYYVQALEYGVAGDEREGAFLGLGSTYRVIGKYSESRAVLEKGMAEFPENNALRVFYSMTLHNLKEHDLAMETLLRIIVETSKNKDIEPYIRAIEFYKDKLDKTW